jgi:uncharacterized protein
MRLPEKFEIVVAKLAPGRQERSFHIDDAFFELFDYGLLNECSIDVVVGIEKGSSFINFDFEFEGTIALTCDRSLEKFDHKLQSSNRLVLKFGEEARELSDEIEIIPFNTQKINIAQYIYEFIIVAIPMKKLHPKYQDESNEDLITYTSVSDETTIEPEPDPRWEKLKKLKKL